MSEATGAPAPANDRQETIQALEAQLAATPRATRPYDHARVAYRLGLAYAESPPGSPAEGLRKALACFDVAAGIFDPRFDPIEHARVLNAAGACHRALGDRRRAAKLFEQAAELLTGRDRDGERAAALNNLGLARAELGEPDLAVEAFDTAVELFDAESGEGRRGQAATLHNRGQARAGTGTEEGLQGALADYDQARSVLRGEDAPYHQGLIRHSAGVALSSLAGVRPDDRDRLLKEAVEAFSDSLEIFTRSAFPFQYALAKHNLGLAWTALGGTANLRRALACFEEAVAVLDPRFHAEAWQQAYASLERVEKELGVSFPGTTRTEHFAALLAAAGADERAGLLQERLFRLMVLPTPRRDASLAELALAVAQLPEKQAAAVMESELHLLMEVPNETLEVVLRARFKAHEQLAPEAREQADRALDQAIGDALGGPQRIFVRDFLYSLGWERP